MNIHRSRKTLKIKAKGNCNQFSRLKCFLSNNNCKTIKAKLKKKVVVPKVSPVTSDATNGRELIGVVPNPEELIKEIPKEAMIIPSDKIAKLFTESSGSVFSDIMIDP